MTAPTTPRNRVQPEASRTDGLPSPPLARPERPSGPLDDARAWLEPATRPRRLADVALVAGGLLGLVVNALVLRTVLADRPSAYMDEATFILTGRFLIERGAVYADALDWTYGSYLWPLVAAYADLAGGLPLVRFVVPLTAACTLYFLLFQRNLLTLLAFSSTHGDLTSAFPLRDYVYDRSELWILAALALVGALRATPMGRRIALGGVLTVLVDDSAVRYYLYPRISTDSVTDPFAITYRGLRGVDGYRLAIADRHYDVIVLDGGIGPIGGRIRQELGADVAR